MVNVAIISVGCLLLVIAVVGYITPIGVTAIDPNIALSIPVAVGICNSGMGQLGQALSGEAVKISSEWNSLLYVIYGAGMLGLLMIISGVVIPRGQKEAYRESEVEDDAIDILEKRYAKGEITKEEFYDMKKNLEK